MPLMSMKGKEEDTSNPDIGSSFDVDDAVLDDNEQATSTLVVKPEEEEDVAINGCDFDIDVFLNSTNEQTSNCPPFVDLENVVSAVDKNSRVNGVLVGSHFYPLQLVPYCHPTSYLTKIKFSLRYMYKNVLTSEQNCIGWLATHSLLPQEQSCKTCAEPMVLVRDRTSWRCRNCKAEFCIRQGTFFKEKRFPLTTILELLYWWSLNTKQGVIFRELEVSRPAIGTWLQYCRKLCEQFFQDHPCRLGGPGRVVEVGDHDFTSRRSDGNMRVLGMVERGNNNSVYLTLIPDRFPQTVFRIIDEVVLPGTRLMSNAAPFYRRLSTRSDLQFVGPGEPDFGVYGITSLWPYVYDSLRRKKGIREKLFKSELTEIQFRLLMGDRLFGELLFWLDFYHW